MGSGLRGDDELFALVASLEGGAAKPAAKEVAHPAPVAAGGGASLEAASADDIWDPQVEHEETFVLGQAPPKGRLPSAAEELLRHRAMGFTKSRFLALGEELGVSKRLKSEAFEKWHFCRKLDDAESLDPLLPGGSKIFFDAGLRAELVSLGAAPQPASNACRELGRAAAAALKTLRRQLRTTSGGTRRVHAAWTTDDRSACTLTLGKASVRLGAAHYAKARELFRRHSGEKCVSKSGAAGARASREFDAAFHEALFACLLRYESLQGGGFQASVPGPAMEVMRRRLGVSFECFASPFNCRWGRYCSAFPDTDAVFGSVGDFFGGGFSPTTGSFEANPPFVPELIQRVSKRIGALLSASKDAPLSFVVIVPAWEATDGWKSLRSSKFLQKFVRLERKSHGYCEGKQQLRRERYRGATCDTSIFVLQNAAGAKKWPCDEATCEELTIAFTLPPAAVAKAADAPSGAAEALLEQRPKRRRTNSASSGSEA